MGIFGKSNRDLLMEKYPDFTLRFIDSEFDDAVIGIFKNPVRVVYSFSKCLDLLTYKADIPSRGRAVDYMNEKYCWRFEDEERTDSPVFLDYESVKSKHYFFSVVKV